MGKRIIFDMDKMLSDNLDFMIIDTSNTEIFGLTRQDLDDLIGRGSWRRNLSKLRKIFNRLADPDAAEIVPVLKKVFDEKKEMVESLNLPQDLKDEILFALSYQRKKVGVDQKHFKKNEDTAPRLELTHKVDPATENSH